METALSKRILEEAAGSVGVDVAGAGLLRNGSHVMWALPGGIVGRVGERGSSEEATKEVAVSRWLERSAVRAVRASSIEVQPTIVDGYPVTWWELLPQHRPASPAELGATLQKLHSIKTQPEFQLPTFSTFDVSRERLDGVQGFDDEVTWLSERMDVLERQFHELVPSMQSGVIHGDAWQGNVAVIQNGESIILDFEAFCIGPLLWDLIPIAADYTDFSRIADDEYLAFVASYGLDATKVPAYRTLADIQEARWTAFALSKAKPGSAEEEEARHRIACLRGDVPKPWKWKAF